MRLLYAFLLLLSCPFVGRAQQPFERFGVKIKMLTLSNGRYSEFFTNDSLRRIGSVIYNTRLRRIAYLLPPDSLVGRVKPEVTSRWFSPDPLAEEELHLSPYVFVANNPVRYMDPDGRIKIDPKTAKAHPGLVAYAKGLAASYASKPAEFRKAFKEMSGLTNKEIKTFLTYNQGPTVAVKPLEGANGAIVQGKDKDGNMVNAQSDGKTTTKQGQGYIMLDDAVVGMLENAKTGADARAGTLMVESTLFHEGVHYGTGVRNTNEKAYDDNGKEKGKSFENRVYGTDINTWNANTVANPSMEPIAPLPPKEVKVSTP